MEALPDLLLPLLLLATALVAGLSDDIPARNRARLVLGGGILLLSAVAASITGPLEFRGPALFVLDSFHQIRFELQADWLPLGLLAAFVGLTVSDVRRYPTSLDRLLPVAVAAFLLADDFGLQFLAGVFLFGRFVDAFVHNKDLEGVDAGLGMFALLFLLLCLGLFSFDLKAESWSGLTSALETREHWTEHELSTLKLAAIVLVFSAVILTGLAPFQALWIASAQSEEKLGASAIVRFVLAIGLLDRGRALLIHASIGQFAISLAFVTFVMTAFCAPFQNNSRRIVRATVASHFALAMTGLVATDELAFAAGVCHAIVACGLFAVLAEDRFIRSRAGLGMIFLIPFGGLSGAFLLLNSATRGEIGLELIGLIAWMILGLTQMHCVRAGRQVVDSSSPIEPPAGGAFFPPVAVMGVATVVLWGACAARLGMTTAFDRVWLIPEVLLGGITGIAIGWSVGCSRPSGEWLAVRMPGIARVFEAQFFLQESLLGTVRLPGAICLGLFEWGREGWRRIVGMWREFRGRRPVPRDESVRWELLRGIACAAVLLIVFLWWGR